LICHGAAGTRDPAPAQEKRHDAADHGEGHEREDAGHASRVEQDHPGGESADQEWRAAAEDDESRRNEGKFPVAVFLVVHSRTPDACAKPWDGAVSVPGAPTASQLLQHCSCSPARRQYAAGGVRRVDSARRSTYNIVGLYAVVRSMPRPRYHTL